ncbi:MAG: hypothetical protein KA807_14015 [Prolixibacteraceae bacterium]|nr:hypothetical protein [Prolixibacteraceae bacterium]
MIEAFIGRAMFAIDKARNKFINAFYKKEFEKCGDDVYIARNCSFTPHNISIGNHVFIGGVVFFKVCTGRFLLEIM